MILSNTTILQLGVAIAVTGDEWMEIVQNGVSYRITLSQLASFVNAMTVPAPNIVVGQALVSGTAAHLSASPLRNGVWLKAAQTNSGAVFAGNSNVTTESDGAGPGYRIDIGEKLFFPVNNTSLIYIIGTANDVVFYEGN